MGCPSRQGRPRTKEYLAREFADFDESKFTEGLLRHSLIPSSFKSGASAHGGGVAFFFEGLGGDGVFGVQVFQGGAGASSARR